MNDLPPEISWKMKTEQPTLPPLGWLTSWSASLTRYYEQNCLKNLPRLLWTNEFLVSSKSQTRHAACWRRYPNLDSELKLLCHAGLKFREISAGFNVSTRSDLSEQKNSKLMLSASRVAWPFCSTALIDKNVIKCHMRNVTLQFFTNVECKSSLFKVEPLFFSLEKVPCILRLTIHGPEKVPQKNGVPSSFGLPWVAPHRPDPPCGKPTWNLWIFLPDSLRQSAEFMGKNASILCNQQTENMVKIPSSILWRSWCLKNCCTCRRRKFGSVPYPQLQGCLYHLLHRFSYIPVVGKTTENESVSPCDSLLFTKWFVSNHQNPNSWTLMVSKRKKTVVSRNLLFRGWALWTKKLLWSEALSLLILWLITRYHNKSGIRIRTYFTPPIPEHFIGIALFIYPWGRVIWRRICGKPRYSEYTTCAIITPILQGIAWKHPQESPLEAGSGNGLAWCETTTSTWHLNDLKLGRHEIQHGLLESCKKLWSMVSLKNFLRQPLKNWYALCWV